MKQRFRRRVQRNNPFQVITDLQVDPSCRSDQNTTIAAIDCLVINGMKPETIFADGGFGSGENIVECHDREVDLQGNLAGVDKEQERLKLADFTFAEDGTTIEACSAGEPPIDQRKQNARKPKSKANESYLVHFDLEKYKSRANVDCFPVKVQKGKAILRLSGGQLSLSQRRREQDKEIFKERNNIRTGIEFTNGEMKTSYEVSKFRVRGQSRVEQTVILKRLPVLSSGW